VCGVTLLRFDQTGLIAGVTLFHAPLDMVLTCSAFLSQQWDDSLGADVS
jgi:hypothetical protein